MARRGSYYDTADGGSYGYGSGGDGSLEDLILRGGDIQAQRAVSSPWARAIPDIVNQIGGAVNQYAETKAKQKAEQDQRLREAAWSDYVEKGDWQADPKKAYGVAKAIWRDDADKHFTALKSIESLMTPKEKPNPEEDQKHLVNVAGAFADYTPDQIQRWSPALKAAVAKVYPDMTLSDDPNQIKTQAAEFFKAAGGVAPKKEQTPEEKAKEEGMIAEARARGTAAGTPVKPEKPETVNLQQTTITGADGQPQLASYNPRTGKYYDTSGKEITGAKPKTAEEKPLTDAEKNFGSFYKSGVNADSNARQLESDTTADIEPGFLEDYFSGLVKESSLSPQRRKYLQAVSDFARAQLRPESGGAISKEELATTARTYFKQRGDSPEAVKQKQLSRELILKGLQGRAGRAALPEVGDKRMINGKVGTWDGKGWVG